MPRQRTAKQFDVVVNPASRARRQYPYVLVLQSDFADTGDERVVAPLAPRAAMPSVTERLVPVVDMDGRQFRILVPFLTTARAGSLREPICNLDRARSAIIAGLDYLFLGF